MSSRPIQTQPQGLLGFLQLKNMGKNPAELPDTLQCVLEMRDWLFESNSEIIIAGVQTLLTTTGVVSLPSSLTVPPNERWALLDFQVSGAVATGEAVSLTLAAIEAPFGAAIPLSTPLAFAGPAAALWGMPRSYRVPLLAPGTVFAVNVNSITTADDIPVEGAVRIARLQV